MMIKKSLLLATSLLATSLFATEVEIQAVAGKNFVDRNKVNVYEDTNTLGLRTNFYLSKNNALQLAYDEGQDVTANKDLHRYSVNYMHIQRDNNSRVHPFMLLGGGYEDGATNEGFMNGGLGLNIELAHNLSLVGEIKGIKKNVSNDFDINTNLGLGIMIGKEPCNTPCKVDKSVEKVVNRYTVVEPVKKPCCVADDKIRCVK